MLDNLSLPSKSYTPDEARGLASVKAQTIELIPIYIPTSTFEVNDTPFSFEVGLAEELKKLSPSDYYFIYLELEEPGSFQRDVPETSKTAIYEIFENSGRSITLATN